MSVRLALRKHDKRIAAKAIQWWTDSIYSHCELEVNGVCYSSSAMDGGVRAKVIDLDPDKWDFVDLPWADAEKILKYFEDTDHQFYGWAGLAMSQVLNRNWTSGKHQFCSEWCASALGLPNGAIYNPGTLGELAVAVNSFLHCGGGLLRRACGEFHHGLEYQQ